MNKAIDLTNRKFGKLICLKRTPECDKEGRAQWVCKCECGGEKIVSGKNLRRGEVKSCGCIHPGWKPNKPHSHGLYGSDRYFLYKNARARANKLQIPINISVSDVPIIPKKCPILGISLHSHRNEGVKGPQRDSPTLDRIVPSKGYIKGNVQVISHRANQLKNDGTLEEMKLIVKHLEVVSGSSGK